MTRQTVAKMNDVGLDVGVIQAGWIPQPELPVQIGSLQTLTARGLRPPAHIIFIDEAHHCRARTYEAILASYPDATVVGLTATPVRKDGRGLGNIFNAMVEGPSVQELVDGKYLVPTIIYAPVIPDLAGVRTQAGDYVESQLAERMDTPALIGGILEHHLKFGEHRKTVIFAVNVGHSVHIKDEFVKAGIKAEHLDGSTPNEERAAILERLANGDTEVVCNCQVLTEGVDIPDVACLVLARPTKSLGLFRQMVGRGLRTSEVTGKKNCIILDHSGSVYRHGRPEDPIEWTLNTDRKARNRTQESRSLMVGKRLCECPRCKALRTAGEACLVCGWEPQRRGENVEILDGELGRIDQHRKAQQHVYSDADCRFWHAALVFIGNERSRTRQFNVRGFVYHRYLEKFGRKPPWDMPPPVPPNAEIRAWVKSRDIAYAKTRSAA